MNLHEYQAKELLKKYSIPVADGIVANSPLEAYKAFEKIGDKSAVIKAQIHAGGRGKAGGVKVVKSAQEAEQVAKELIGKNLVTFQTDKKGQPVNSVYVAKDIYPVERELYLGAVLDRSTRTITFMLSSEGGVEIETVAHESPEKILKISVYPQVGVQEYQAREVGFALGLNNDQIKQLYFILDRAYKAFIKEDFSLFEVNPLAVLKSGDLCCVDAKISIDDNALYRSSIADWKDKSQENPVELEAAEKGLVYINLDGNIGCMVNGAGLAMATMDIIKLKGGEPANFMDIGGSADKERIIEAFKIVLSDSKVKGVLLNVFGGIVRCDMVAQAIIDAAKTIKIDRPVVVRLQGNNSDIAAQLLKDAAHLGLVQATTMDEAADKIVKIVNG